MGTPRAAAALPALLALLAANAPAQPDAAPALDEDLFGELFDEDAADARPGWLDGFTGRISQQLSGQVHRRTVRLDAGGTAFDLPRRARVETNRLGLNLRYQRAFAPGWLLQGSGQARAYWNDDYEYRAAGGRVETETRLNELFVQRSFGGHSLRLGRQTVVWGETVGNSVLDVINHVEFRDFTIIDIEDARLNQWMLVWDWFGGGGDSFSSFVNLHPEFNPAPVRGSPLFFDPGHHLPDHDRGGERLLEAGVRWRRSIEGSDIALMAARLHDNQVRWTPPPPGGDTAGTAVGDFLLLGFSANRALGRLLLALDLAFRRGAPAEGFALPGAPAPPTEPGLRRDELGASFGFEYGIDNERNLSLGIQARRPLDGPADEEDLFGSWLLRYGHAMRNGNLTLSATLQGGLDAESLLALVGLDYAVDDRWAVGGQLIGIAAGGGSPLALFDRDLRLAATLSYSF